MKKQFKKTFFKKVLCAGLTAAMLLGLAACGQDAESVGNNSNNKGGKSNPNAALAKEYVYSEQTLELPGMGDDMYIRAMNRKDDMIYVICEIYDWSAESNQNSLKILSMKMDGSDARINDLQMKMDGADGEAAEEDTAEEKEVAVDEDGIADDMALEMPMQNFYEYTGIGQVIIHSDGKLYGVKNYYYEDYSDPANYVSINDNYVCCWNSDGTMNWEVKMEPLQTEESYAYVQSIVPMPDESVLLLISGEKMEKIIVKS